MINFEEFQKIELKTAKVKEAEKVEGSEKLLKLKIDLGDEERQLIAGIRQFYSPEEMVGKGIVVVANLEPKTIFGLESHGMLLAANDEGKPVILTSDKEVSPGTKIT